MRGGVVAQQSLLRHRLEYTNRAAVEALAAEAQACGEDKLADGAAEGAALRGDRRNGGRAADGVGPGSCARTAWRRWRVGDSARGQADLQLEDFAFAGECTTPMFAWSVLGPVPNGRPGGGRHSASGARAAAAHTPSLPAGCSATPRRRVQAARVDVRFAASPLCCWAMQFGFYTPAVHESLSLYYETAYTRARAHEAARRQCA